MAFKTSILDHALRLALVSGCFFLVACGSQTEMGPSERLAIKFVKAYTSEDGQFSVLSNIQQQAGAERGQGNMWKDRTWQAGLPSQNERLVAALSQYFNLIESPRERQVRFTYTDKNGVHEAVWDIDLYTKHAEPQNESARQFTFPQEQTLVARRSQD